MASSFVLSFASFVVPSRVVVAVAGAFNRGPRVEMLNEEKHCIRLHCFLPVPHSPLLVCVSRRLPIGYRMPMHNPTTPTPTTPTPIPSTPTTPPPHSQDQGRMEDDDDQLLNSDLFGNRCVALPACLPASTRPNRATDPQLSPSPPHSPLHHQPLNKQTHITATMPPPPPPPLPRTKASSPPPPPSTPPPSSPPR